MPAREDTTVAKVDSAFQRTARQLTSAKVSEKLDIRYFITI